LAKKWSAEAGVYITRESMKLMGGLGYIEDTVIPKIMRELWLCLSGKDPGIL
jgi:alkylation response protein AidB-like acyl-CoA dehydrogenase